MSAHAKDAPLELKLGSSETQLPDNTQLTQAPVNVEDVAEKKPVPNEEHAGEAAWDDFIHNTPKLLGRVFDTYGPSAKKDKSFIAENFSSKDYEAHSPLLRKYAQAGHIPSDASLAERTRRLVGR